MLCDQHLLYILHFEVFMYCTLCLFLYASRCLRALIYYILYFHAVYFVCGPGGLTFVVSDLAIFTFTLLAFGLFPANDVLCAGFFYSMHYCVAHSQSPWFHALEPLYQDLSSRLYSTFLYSKTLLIFLTCSLLRSLAPKLQILCFVLQSLWLRSFFDCHSLTVSH